MSGIWNNTMKIFIFLLIILFCSCGKEPEKRAVQTIYPLPYLPVYPGSRWRYLNSDGDTITYTTGNEYSENAYRSYALNGNYTDPVKVPYWNGQPIYGYSTPVEVFPQHSGHVGSRQVGFLSVTSGDRFTTDSYKGLAWREVGNTDTSISVDGNLYNHVIRVNNWAESSFYNYPRTLNGATYYARDIGLIKEEDLRDSTITLRLLDYFINR